MARSLCRNSLIAISAGLVLTSCQSVSKIDAEWVNANAANTISKTPPSCVAIQIPRPNDNYLPDGKKWFSHMVPGLTGPSEYCPRQPLQIGEIKGWLVGRNDLPCNDQPDTGFNVAVDPEWLLQKDVNPNDLFTVGSVASQGRDQLAGANPPLSYVGTPTLHIEAIGWAQRKQDARTPPTDWAFPTDCGGKAGTTLWAYDPNKPFPDLPALEVRTPPQYVRVVGGFVTDSSHAEGVDKFETAACGVVGALCGSGQEERVAACQWAGITIARCTLSTDDPPDDPARWTEIHPPDLIAPQSDQTQMITMKEVAVLSENCGLGTCAATSLDADLFAPTVDHRGKAFYWREFVSHKAHETTPSTLVDWDRATGGAQVTVFADHIHVHVKVRGESLDGAPGKFRAIYYVGWR